MNLYLFIFLFILIAGTSLGVVVRNVRKKKAVVRKLEADKKLVVERLKYICGCNESAIRESVDSPST